MGVGTSKMQDPSGATKEYVMKEVKANKVVIFSKTYCPYCTKTKNLFLNTLKVDDTKVIELDQLSNGTTIQNTLAKITGQRTVPNVFVGGEHLGGNDDTHAAYSDGRLEKMLQGWFYRTDSFIIYLWRYHHFHNKLVEITLSMAYVLFMSMKKFATISFVI